MENYRPLKTSREDALACGEARYLDPHGCPNCPNPGPKTRYVSGDVCVGCLRRDVDMTRQLLRRGVSGPFPESVAQALAEGVDYFFEDLCTKGPHVRRTSIRTRRCLTCDEERGRGKRPRLEKAPGDGRSTTTSRFTRENPDMVLGKDEARLLGLTQFRTGQPCRKGHTGWRHVASGACVDCRKEG